MSVQVENLEKNMAKLTIEVSAENFEKAVQAAYNKQKKNITIPGFRKGKAPRKMIEKMYGAGIFYDDAVNATINNEYPGAANESGLDIVSSPEIEVVQIEAGKPFIFTALVAVKPEVTLGEYKGVEVEIAKAEVTAEEIEGELRREQENNARTIEVTDRAVADGDLITLDFDGSVDGVAFDGGKGEDYALTIGSNAFIPGFEDQLIGVALNTETEVKVTFPEDYHEESLAGKEAVFKCLVKKITVKELPALDDEFAKDVSEFDTMDEYRASVEKNLKERKEEQVNREKEDKAVEAAAANAEMDIPEAMIETEVEAKIREFAARLRQQGIEIDQYYQFTGLDAEQMKENIRPQVIKTIQSRLVLEKVAEVENIQASEEAFNEEIDRMAKAYKLEAEKIKEMLSDVDKEQIRKDLAVREAVKFLADAAKVTEVVENKEA